MVAEHLVTKEVAELDCKVFGTRRGKGYKDVKFLGCGTLS